MDLSDSDFRLKLLREMDLPPSFRRTLVVRSYPEESRPDFVASILGKHDTKVSIRDKWMSPGLSFSAVRKQWCGAVAIYDCGLRARLAARELRMLTRSVQTMMFPEFIMTVGETEVTHRAMILRSVEDCSSNQERRFEDNYHQNKQEEEQLEEHDLSGGCVVLRGRRTSLWEHHGLHFRELFARFGQMADFVLYCDADAMRRSTTTLEKNGFGNICEARYRHMTPAVLASVLMNGLSYGPGFGHVSADLRLTPRLRRFLQCAEAELAQAMAKADAVGGKRVAEENCGDCVNCITKVVP